MRRVAIVQDTVPHYRVPFFAALRERLARQDVALALLHGGAPTPEEHRIVETQLPWATRVRTRSLGPGGRARYHEVLRVTARAHLVVVEQANRMLENYPLLLRQRFGGPPVALWGHGANLQADPSRSAAAAERWKRSWATSPHWWFAYTEGSARRVEALGFDPDRVTVVQNAVATSWSESASSVPREQATAVFVGRLYDLKRLPFLVKAGDVIADMVPGFRLVVVGDGPEREGLERLARDRAWLDVRGTLLGADKTQALQSASVHVMPGLVGLSVVDTFAAGTPPVVVDLPFHSPEVEYVENGVNGLALPVETTPEEYGRAVADLLHDEARLNRLRSGCIEAARTYTVEAMTERFASGVVAALDLARADR